MKLGTLPPAPPGSELDLRRQEAELLHLPIDRTVLRSLSVWDAKPSALREARPGEIVDDSTPVMILHAWATWCEPCKNEFPMWKELGPRLVTQHRGRVRIVHVALQNDASDMASFVKEMRGKLPFPVQHFDRSERLANQIRDALPKKQMTLPVTLVLDPDRFVRQAFIGSIAERWPELANSTGRLLHLVQLLDDEALKPKPVQEDASSIFSK